MPVLHTCHLFTWLSFSREKFAWSLVGDVLPPYIPRTVRKQLFLSSFVFLISIVVPHIAEARSIGTPRTLRIPKIKVDAEVIALGIMPDGKLDAPKNASQVGWWNGGKLPGEQGTAVIDGHLNLQGKPAVFWNLRRLRRGDRFEVEDEKGEKLTFQIRKVKKFPVANAPLDDIFLKAGGRYLNLITCAGQWDDAIGHYNERLVIFSELVSDSEISGTRSAYTARRSS